MKCICEIIKLLAQVIDKFLISYILFFIRKYLAFCISAKKNSFVENAKKCLETKIKKPMIILI